MSCFKTFANNVTQYLAPSISSLEKQLNTVNDLFKQVVLLSNVILKIDV